MAVHLSREEQILSLTVEEPVGSGDPDRYIAALDEIAEAAAPFVLRVAFRTRLDLPQEQRKAQNLWFKRTRQRMNALCRAAAIVRKDASEEMQRTFGGLWRFPVLVTDSDEEAGTFLATHQPQGTAP
ncbi:hypothetical protein [Chelativorans sp. M5D2P16]|uniref:hypothetical protein n=1 Tax=Chelativorans sp. M5D2P16 TaxID=3095678 RepID=UPI002ACA0B9F|nr:hypothetical protein [Chelativorans sp. M5D2P16]MDZ5698229.1 hypothetical protein [Chelativorans sp. M5D2P16]